MRTTTFLITIAGVALTAACHRAPSSEALPPQPSGAELAAQRRTQDSLDVVQRATADSVARAREVALANQARADSIERVRLTAATATREAADKAARKDAELRAELGVLVHFDVARAQIQPDDRAALDRKVAILNANPTVRLQITGACDDRGSDQDNQALGHRRATAVKRYLVEQGIDAARLDEMSSGEESPIDPGSGEAAWARNRRAEFVVVSGAMAPAITQPAKAEVKQPAVARAEQPPVAPTMAQPAMAQAKQQPVAPTMARPAMAQTTKPPVMPHEKAGREQCAMCHSGAMEGIKVMPADHKGRGNDVCTLCHAKDSPAQTAAGPATAMAHEVAGREQCLMCHGGTMEGMKAAPANHKGIDAKTCTLCHTAAKG